MSIRNLITKTRKELFYSYTDTLITIAISTSIIYVCWNLVNWLLHQAEWAAITKNIPLYSYGSYPENLQWRPSLWLLILASLVLTTLISPQNNKIKRILIISWFSILPIGLFLLGGGLGLKSVYTDSWGGLSLTIILAIGSASLSLPAGILLALGRQSDVSLIKISCRIYIDFVRALPLISVLFFGQLLIPLFLPVDIEINRVARAVIAFSFFASAYVAEDIRGGLQSIPYSQKEAAYALGLNQRQALITIVLPQAIKTAIPALTNQSIGLLQNTSLMAILGLMELLGISRSLLANPSFIGNYLEVYIWTALIYWIICTIIALIAKRIENDLNHLKLVRG